MKEFTATLFDNQKYALGEAPFYDPRYNRFSWVDIPKGELWTLTDGEKNCFLLGQAMGASIPLADTEGCLLAGSDGLYVYENNAAKLLISLASYFQPYWRCNDAKADPAGRIFFGASVGDDAHEAEGALFCYDHGNIKCLQKNTKIANGMAWSSDRKHFYFSDSLEHGILLYDYDINTGDIFGRRKLFSIENGVPDGMCIDSDDNLWVAIWGGSRIEKRDGRTGEKLAEIRVPAEHVTSCCFIDETNRLFITTSGDGLTGDGDGKLYTCDTDSTGVAIDYVKIR